MYRRVLKSWVGPDAHERDNHPQLIDSADHQAQSFWKRSATRQTSRWLGLVGFVAVAWLYLATGLLAPMWAVVVLWVISILLLVVLVKAWKTNPWRARGVPLVAYLIWAAVLLAGEFFLGWTA